MATNWSLSNRGLDPCFCTFLFSQNKEESASEVLISGEETEDFFFSCMQLKEINASIIIPDNVF